MKTLLWLTLLSCALVAMAAYPSLGFAADDRPAQNGDELPGAAEVPAAPAPPGQTARYIVTYAKSNTQTTALRTATVVSVTNQGTASCTVSVQFLTGVGGGVAGTASAVVGVGSTLDFCSRPVPSGVTTCNALSVPSLVFFEGRAQVNSSTSTTLNNCQRIALSGRVYYTPSTADSPVSAITDSNIVRFNQGNAGD
jgi:hypothetical protein